MAFEKVKTDAIVEFIYVVTEADTANESIENGTIIFCEETHKIYLKMNDTVTQYS